MCACLIGLRILSCADVEEHCLTMTIDSLTKEAFVTSETALLTRRKPKEAFHKPKAFDPALLFDNMTLKICPDVVV